MLKNLNSGNSAPRHDSAGRLKSRHGDRVA